MTELKIGSGTKPEDRPAVLAYQKAMKNRFASYAKEPNGDPLKEDLYFGDSELKVHNEWQRRMKRAITSGWGVIVSHEEYELIVKGTLPTATPAKRRKIWFLSAPGSGADANIGPAFEVGRFCQDVLKLNHIALVFPKGGYLGLMGGDPGLSYLDVTYSIYKKIEWELDNCPDINDPEFELWFSAYSQSQDGVEDAVEILFGDGCVVNGVTYGPGKYRHLRDRINGLLAFGNPSRQNRHPKSGPGYERPRPLVGWGIARKVRPLWLVDKVWDITTTGDFYACVADRVRPLFYEWFIRAETEIPFVVYCAQIILPAISNMIPVVGPFLGPLFPMAMVLQTGMTSLLPLLTGITGQLGSATSTPNPELLKLLSVQGLLTNLPDLMTLVMALPGLQAHGEYHLPKAEFDGRTGIQVGCDIVAAFRKKEK